MKKFVSFKAPLALSALFLFSAVSMSGCSGDNDDTSAQAPMAEQATKAMDVKPADAPMAEKKPLVEIPSSMEEAKEVVSEKVDATQQVVEEKVEATKEVVTEKVDAAKEVVSDTTKAVSAKVDQVATAVSTPSGQSAYSTCVGCHGANGEGGVGPRLNNQTVEDIVAKLEKYKAGEQVGPMTGMMAPMAMPLSTDDMQVIAEYITTK